MKQYRVFMGWNFTASIYFTNSHLDTAVFLTISAYIRSFHAIVVFSQFLFRLKLKYNLTQFWKGCFCEFYTWEICSITAFKSIKNKRRRPSKLREQ